MRKELKYLILICIIFISWIVYVSISIDKKIRNKKTTPVEVVKIEPEVQTVKQEPVVEERYERPKRKKIKRLEIRVVNNKRRLNYD